MDDEEVVIVFRADGFIDMMLPDLPPQSYEEEHPMYRAFLVSTLFRHDDDEVAAIRERLSDIGDELVSLEEMGDAEPLN